MGHAAGCRWGPLGALQPSEFLKFTLLLVQVHCLSRQRWDLALMSVLPPVLLVLKQPDLGTAACYAAITWGTLFVAGLDWRPLLAGTVGLAGWPVRVWMITNVNAC